MHTDNSSNDSYSSTVAHLIADCLCFLLSYHIMVFVVAVCLCVYAVSRELRIECAERTSTTQPTYAIVLAHLNNAANEHDKRSFDL
jgi:hypothetical protein